jgi:hypothetical protein
MNAVMVTFYGTAKLDKGNEEIMEVLESDSKDPANDEATVKFMEKLMGPVLPRVTDLMVRLAFSGKSEEEMDSIMNNLDITSSIVRDSKAFIANFEQHSEKAKEFLENTSKENLVAVAQVVKATTELNGIVTELEQNALNEFCQKYNITEDELKGSNDDAALLEMFLNSSEDKKLIQMENFNLEYLEEKYPGISLKKGWLDLHFKRGAEEISDENFKLELFNFGREEIDADNYIIFLNNMNDRADDFIENSNFFEMIDINMKYDGLTEKTLEIKESIKKGDLDAVRKLLQDEFNMSSEEIEIVLTNYQFEMKMNDLES